LLLSDFRAPCSEVFFDDLEIPGQQDHGAEGGARRASGILVTQIAETDSVGGAGVLDSIVLELFGFGDGILGPTQIHASEVGLFRGHGNRRFFGFVADLHLGFGIDLGRHRIEKAGVSTTPYQRNGLPQ